MSHGTTNPRIKKSFQINTQKSSSTLPLVFSPILVPSPFLYNLTHLQFVIFIKSQTVYREIFLINSLLRLLFGEFEFLDEENESYEKSLGGGGKRGSGGGAEGSGHLQMELHNEIYSPVCQEQPPVLFSVEEAALSFLFLIGHGFRQTEEI